MKKKLQVTKKVLAAMLSAAMVLSMAACGNESSANSSGSDSQNDAEQSSAEESSVPESSSEAEDEGEEEAPEEAAYDFGGRVFRIASYEDASPDPESSNAITAEYAARIAYVTENYNCSVEWVALDGSSYVNQYVTSVLAGDPVTDIGYASTDKGVVPNLVEGGIVLALDDFGLFDFDDYKWSPGAVNVGTYKGKHYQLGLRTGAEVNFGIWWNRTLFEEYNLPDLYELYENGEWTWEKFKEVALAGNIDSDGDGQVDIYGFSYNENLPMNFIESNGATVLTRTASGVNVDLSDARIIEALEFVQDFATTVPHLYPGDGTAFDGAWDKGMCELRDRMCMMGLNEPWIQYYWGETGDEFGFVPMPMGPSGSTYTSYCAAGGGGFFILNGVEKPEEVAQFYKLITDIDETISEDEYYEILQEDIENSYPDEHCIEIIKMLNDNKRANSPGLKCWTDLNEAVMEMFDEVVAGNMTPATAIETYQSRIDTLVADYGSKDWSEEMEENYHYEEPEEEAEE